MIRKTLILLFWILLTITISLENAKALDVGAESVEDYAGCGCAFKDGTKEGNLFYANNQAGNFISEIKKWHTKKFWYKDRDAWASDLVEDGIGSGGTDNKYGDNVHILFVSGHGYKSSGVDRGIRLCKTNNYQNCRSYISGRSRNMYLGETSGQSYSSNPGNLRFLILCACYSVDKDKAASIWGPVFWNGQNLLYVMGYSGDSSDKSSNSNVGKDFANKAAGAGWTLKQAWFWAMTEDGVRDTGALISRGSSRSAAINNRDNMRLSQSPPATWPPNYVAWSWYQG